jgi:hypothetical protein
MRPPTEPSYATKVGDPLKPQIFNRLPNECVGYGEVLCRSVGRNEMEFDMGRMVKAGATLVRRFRVF